jgi:uncharacterized protein YndB with AHSA1/START domain
MIRNQWLRGRGRPDRAAGDAWGDDAMVDDRIEREILIDAPVEAVWVVVTRPEHISRWWTDEAEIEARPGGLGVLTFNLRATNRRATVPITVEALEPPHRFAFRWMYPAGAEARPGNSILVEFVLTAEGDGTRLRVAESGLLAMEWPAEAKSSYADEHGTGWDFHLPHLREYAARRAGAAGSR